MNRWAGGLIIDKDGKVALQQWDTKVGIKNSGKITMFGGAVESGESIEEGVLREWREELDLNTKIEKIKFFGKYLKTKEIDNEDCEVNVFLTNIENPKLLNIREGKEIVWVKNVNDYKNLNLSRITRLALDQYFGC